MDAIFKRSAERALCTGNGGWYDFKPFFGHSVQPAIFEYVSCIQYILHSAHDLGYLQTIWKCIKIRVPKGLQLFGRSMLGVQDCWTMAILWTHGNILPIGGVDCRVVSGDGCLLVHKKDHFRGCAFFHRSCYPDCLHKDACRNLKKTWDCYPSHIDWQLSISTMVYPFWLHNIHGAGSTLPKTVNSDFQAYYNIRTCSNSWKKADLLR